MITDDTQAGTTIGVLLVNLGTPAAPTPAAVRSYLAEFLADPRVVEIPKLIWWPILHGIVLRTRPKKSAHAYSQVWTDEGSPLAAITARQARALQARLDNDDHSANKVRVKLGWAMRYGEPALAHELKKLIGAGAERILIAPLYPQYCGATTASTIDALGTALRKMRAQPAIRTLPAYGEDGAFIEALRSDLARQIRALTFEPEVLLLSFHGMPMRAIAAGDPYADQCHRSAKALREALSADFPALRIETSFQSRFGRGQWLEPATDAVLANEAARGTKSLAIAAPGFAADCLETLEELAIRGREIFVAAGGEHFATFACLNDSEAGINMLETLIRRELQGWVS